MTCAGPTYEDNLLKTDAEVAAKVLPDLHDIMRSLAVILISHCHSRPTKGPVTHAAGA